MVDVNYDNYKFRVTSYLLRKKKVQFFFLRTDRKGRG